MVAYLTDASVLPGEGTESDGVESESEEEDGWDDPGSDAVEEWEDPGDDEAQLVDLAAAIAGGGHHGARFFTQCHSIKHTC